jgi:hypothetical protein
MEKLTAWAIISPAKVSRRSLGTGTEGTSAISIFSAGAGSIGEFNAREGFSGGVVHPVKRKNERHTIPITQPVERIQIITVKAVYVDRRDFTSYTL